MTSLEDFKEILAELQVKVPEESLVFFRDLIDMQADTILESWIKENMNNKNE